MDTDYFEIVMDEVALKFRLVYLFWVKYPLKYMLKIHTPPP